MGPALGFRDEGCGPAPHELTCRTDDKYVYKYSIIYIYIISAVPISIRSRWATEKEVPNSLGRGTTVLNF